MILKSMTAVFGKLEGQTLTLTPGLNLIEEPNEWGKSTWCAFLLAMLYGIDTGQRAKQGVIPDKERYKPWSGRPMEGRMDLNWQGRDITIQRTTKGRIPMGEFRAYETASGQPVPELTKDNCGLLLLGVERPVYQRSGFLRLADLPVTQDEALARRLNALVTTGSESTAGLDLAKQLRDLQNRCRHNKTGQLPQAEARLAELQDRLTQAEERTTEQARLEARSAGLRQEEEALHRHEAVLSYREAAEKQAALTLARNRQKEAQAQADRWEARVRDLPRPEEARERIRQLEELSGELEQLQSDTAAVPPVPETPVCPPALLSEESPEDRAERDLERIGALDRQKGGARLPWILGAGALLALGIGLLFVKLWLGLSVGVLALGLLIFGLADAKKRDRAYAAAQTEKAAILKSYGGDRSEALLPIAKKYAAAMDRYRQETRDREAHIAALEARRRNLQEKTGNLTRNQGSVAQAVSHQREILGAWDRREEALRDLARAREHTETLERLAGNPAPMPEPAEPDELDLSREETRLALDRNLEDQARIQSALNQSRGRQAAQGDPGAMAAEADGLKDRIARLEDIYAAMGYAQAALKTAGEDLRRQFAPRITAQARDILGELTGGRYDKLLWEEDLSLSAGTREETTLQSALRRSDGTLDQIYLSLRLAVCRELLGPEVPIVLDDALVRFDDRRLERALDLLKKEGEDRQILLFTCQSREGRMLGR